MGGLSIPAISRLLYNISSLVIAIIKLKMGQQTAPAPLKYCEKGSCEMSPNIEQSKMAEEPTVLYILVYLAVIVLLNDL
jgi:hypothetical protein